MLPACWKNNRLEKSVVQIITKNSHQKISKNIKKYQKIEEHFEHDHLRGELFKKILF
jgi:hypothetical protein